MGKKKITILSVLLEILATLKAIGSILAMTRTASVHVKEADGRFLTLKDGWIKDSQTGLEWGPSSDKSMKWEEAKKFCADHGGRLPNVQELFSLIDRTKYSPATLIPGMKSEWYWTDEPVAGSAGSAWYVGFFGGYVGTGGYKDGGGHVRSVRSSQ